MFCPECGVTNEDRARFCEGCGIEFKFPPNRSGGGVKTAYPRIQGSALKGFFLLLVSFFTMPIRTLKITLTELKEIGRGNKLDVEATEIPHLTWLTIASRFLTSIGIFLIILIGFIKGLESIKEYSGAELIVNLFGKPIAGIFGAILFNWIVMIILELLTISIGIANNIRKIAQGE